MIDFSKQMKFCLPEWQLRLHTEVLCTAAAALAQDTHKGEKLQKAFTKKTFTVKKLLFFNSSAFLSLNQRLVGQLHTKHSLLKQKKLFSVFNVASGFKVYWEAVCKVCSPEKQLKVCGEIRCAAAAGLAPKSPKQRRKVTEKIIALNIGVLFLYN